MLTLCVIYVTNIHSSTLFFFLRCQNSERPLILAFFIGPSEPVLQDPYLIDVGNVLILCYFTRIY